MWEKVGKVGKVVNTMKSRPAKYDHLTNHRGVTPNDAAIAGALLPLDKVAIETEGRWGIGVLPRLVSPATASKFESARVKLDHAIEAGDADEVARRAAVMIKGWRALETEADISNSRVSVHAWAVCVPGLPNYMFVPHEVDTAAAAKAFPDHRVWSYPEVVRILASHELLAVQAAKDTFPGAVVEAARVKRPLEDDISDVGVTLEETW